jgi:hypothetical protein
MARPKRTSHQRQADLLVVEQLMIKGWGPTRIALHLSAIREYSIGKSMVIYDQTQLEHVWREQRLDRRDAMKMKALAEINLVRATAWDAWERSVKDSVKVRGEQQGATADGAAKAQPFRVTQEKLSQAGDPAFLRVVLDCNRREAALLGLDAGPEGMGEVIDAEPIKQTRVMLYVPKKVALKRVGDTNGETTIEAAH